MIRFGDGALKVDVVTFKEGLRWTYTNTNGEWLSVVFSKLVEDGFSVWLSYRDLQDWSETKEGLSFGDVQGLIDELRLRGVKSEI